MQQNLIIFKVLMRNRINMLLLHASTICSHEKMGPELQLEAYLNLSEERGFPDQIQTFLLVPCL